MYLWHLQHEIKQIKSNVFYSCFILKSPPSPGFPPTVYLSQPGLTHVVHGLSAWIYAHPSYVQNKNSSQFTVQSFINTDQCSSTCPNLCLHIYGGPTGCPWVELCTSWVDGKEVGIFHHAHQVALQCLMKGIHGSLGPMWAECLFSFRLCQLCGVDFCLPFLLLHSCILMCLISLKKSGKIISTYMYLQCLWHE